MPNPIEFPTNPDGTVRELGITETISTELPDWYRTDTPHINHPHETRNGRCLPGTVRHRDVRRRPA